MVETQSRVLGARHRKPAKKQERQQRGRTACSDRFCIHFSLPRISDAPPSNLLRATRPLPLAALIQSFVVITTARLSRHPFAPDLHIDAAEFTVVLSAA
jgi:hypothetical protein